MDFAEDLRRDDEDARPDHRPDDEGGGIEPGDRLDEIGLWRLRGGHRRRKLVAPAEGRYVLRRSTTLTREDDGASLAPGRRVLRLVRGGRPTQHGRGAASARAVRRAPRAAHRAGRSDQAT